MWELKAAGAAFLVFMFVAVLRSVTPRRWRYACPQTWIAVVYLIIGITIGVLLA